MRLAVYVGVVFPGFHVLRVGNLDLRQSSANVRVIFPEVGSEMEVFESFVALIEKNLFNYSILNDSDLPVLS